MTDDDLERLVMLDEMGLSTEGLGPVQEWSPVPRGAFQRRHGMFWAVVSGILPDDDKHDEEWMTEEASEQLANN